jgi:signal transduction histidine kinase
MIRRTLHLLVLLLTLTTGLDVSARAPVVLGAETTRVNLTEHLDWLTDAQGTLTLEEARQRSDFVPLPKALSEGFTSAAIWLRFDVQPQTPVAGSTWMLEVANALLDDVRLYSSRQDGSYIEQRSGEDIARTAWPVDYRNPTFALWIESDEPRRYYLRISARNALSTSIHLWHPGTFSIATRDEAFNYGVFYGVYILILVFHLFFWFATRERLGGWYVPYVAINFLGAAISTGHFQKLTGLPGPMSDMLLGVMLCMPLAISNTFTLTLLELASVMPRFVRIYLPLMWSLGIGLSLIVVTGHFGAGVAGAQAITLACIALLIVIGIHLALRGHRPARFFLFAFGIFYAAVVLRYLRNLGILEPTLLTEFSVPVGALLHMIVMSLGITGQYTKIKREKLAAQAALNESLEVQVQERTITLMDEIARRKKSENEVRHALDVMGRARQEQQDFVAMVSHEFRTPLAIINTVTQQLAGNLDAPREKSLERCTDIRDSTRRMTDMMDEFLSFDRLGGEFHPSLRPINPVQLAHSIAEEFDVSRLRIEDECSLDKLVCDVELLRVALRNLLVNALRHSPPEFPVHLITRATADGSVVFEVKDAGSGIPADEIPRLFQKYFRGRGALNKPGAGLGLYLVERIAELHGGMVSVDSTQGQGTSFKLTIPAASE